jgi:hypothetical protein
MSGLAYSSGAASDERPKRVSTVGHGGCAIAHLVGVLVVLTHAGCLQNFVTDHVATNPQGAEKPTLLASRFKAWVLG